ncbi:MAG: FkbM family methyltransferase [Bacteroidota bacterium]
MKTLVKLYARMHHLVHEYFSFNLPGLGFLYRQLKEDFIFPFRGNKMYFNHKIADNYGRLLNENFNEPETHLFLDKVFALPEINSFHFVDIGANIGEFLIDYSNHPKISRVTAFEPQTEQIKVLQKSIELNDFKKSTIIAKPVADSTKDILFNFSSKNSTASGITEDTSKGTIVQSTSIDEYFKDKFDQEYVFLIDTEGAELDIMRGGRNLIQKMNPLIIFEYNHVTKEHFTIDDVRLELGDNYEIYKLDSKGSLNTNLKNTWNLVAFPKRKDFMPLLTKI